MGPVVAAGLFVGRLNLDHDRLFAICLEKNPTTNLSNFPWELLSFNLTILLESNVYNTEAYLLDRIACYYDEREPLILY